MNKFVVLVFPDEAKAFSAVRELDQLHAESAVTVFETTVVKRDDDGKLNIKRRDEEPVGTAVGALTGGLIGLLGGPVGGVLGVTGGITVGGWGDLLHAEVGDEFLEEVQRELAPGNYAVIAEIAEEWTAPVDTRMQALGAVKIIREPRKVFVDDLFEKRVDANKAELADWKAQRAGEKAERMDADIDAEIEGARQKLQRTAEKARKRLDDTKEEMEAKLMALEEQSAKANPEVRDRVKQRIAELRRDFEQREKMLTRAYETTQEALQP